MSADGGVSRGRTAAAAALCLAVLAVGVTLALTATKSSLDLALPFAPLILVPAYLLSHRITLDFEVGQESRSIALSQLPLALGTLLVAPLAHLATRLVAVIVHVIMQRQGVVKALFNVAVAAFDVGATVTAVSLVDSSAPGPKLWLALFAGMLVGDLVSHLVLNAVWVLVGMPVTAGQVLKPMALGVIATTAFTGLAVVAVSAALTEPFTAVIGMLIAAGATLAYRKHRQLADQQAATQELYSFVRSLGPVDVDADEVEGVLERVRLLLHAAHLDLTVPRPNGTWLHLASEDGRPCRRWTDDAAPSRQQPASPERPPFGASSMDSMSTTLFGSEGMAGALTARGRLGAVRNFDMGDLRLLETVANEVGTALDRGRLLTDLRRAATTDALTGLPNLGETSRLVSRLCVEHLGGVALAAVAVDSFREVNDTLGHEVGDGLLLEVSRRLRAVNAAAVVGRIGGGRFAIAVPTDEGRLVPELFGLDLRAQVEGSVQLGAVGTLVRLSVGVVHAPDHGQDGPNLLRRAETAMNSAKHSHGGPVVWAPAYEVQGQRRLAVVTALREAISTGAIGLAFQPKVDTLTGAATGVEALARWTHPALGAVSPEEFIPLAEASGFMRSLTSSVLRQALTACKGWQRRGGRIGVSVNVSADTVLDPDFVTEVSAILTSVGMPPQLLTLELTEGVLVTDPMLAVERLKELRALGVRISMDDFGTGYSSLTYLKVLPLDEVKIDKTFVDGLSIESTDQAVVRAVINIAHALELVVVAEGVESNEQQVMLHSLGVDQVQGYLYARPLPAIQMATWLRRRDAASRSAH